MHTKARAFELVAERVVNYALLCMVDTDIVAARVALSTAAYAYLMTFYYRHAQMMYIREKWCAKLSSHEK